MARPLDQEKRTQILADVVDYMAIHGLSDLSLRKVAASLGTTSRMLVYYFGTKEELLTQALATQHPDLGALFEDVDDADSLCDALLGLWTMMLGDSAAAKSTQLMLQAMGIAVVREGPFADYAARTIDVLVSAVSAAVVRMGVDEQRAVNLATAVVSGLRGTLMDYLITHDLRRTDQAAHQLVEMVVEAAGKAQPA